MTYLIRMRLGYNVEQTVSILKGTKKGIEEILHDKFSVYYDKSIDEICKELDINLISKNGSLPKNYAQIISSKILGIKGNKLDSIEESSKANIKLDLPAPYDPIILNEWIPVLNESTIFPTTPKALGVMM